MAQVTLKVCSDKNFGSMVEDVLDCFHFPLQVKVDFSYKYNSKKRYALSLFFSDKSYNRSEVSISWPSISTSINETDFIRKQYDVDTLVEEIDNWTPEDILLKHAQLRQYDQNGSGISFLGMLAIEVFIMPFERPPTVFYK